MRDAIVIGCGIVGATIGQALRKKSLNVLILDDRRPMSGTQASGGHLKPEWFSGMKKVDYEPAMELLDDLWTLNPETYQILLPVFQTRFTTTTVYRVDTKKVLRTPYTLATVTLIESQNTYPVISYRLLNDLNTTIEERTKLLIIAAGVWSNDFVKGPSDLKSKLGISFLFPGKIEYPFILPWAPYKQVVAHQQEKDTVWIGDGSSILDKNWTEHTSLKCLRRCREVLGDRFDDCKPKSNLGARPYCKPVKKNDPCYCKQVNKHVWVVTGSGKLGTIAGGWAAKKIVDSIE